MRKVRVEPKANNGSRAERLRWGNYEDFEMNIDGIGERGMRL
jgi:hypothetical protein